MKLINLDSIMMQRFIDAIDDRIYCLNKVKVYYHFLNNESNDEQYIYIDLRDSDGDLICRIIISNNKDTAYYIEKVDQATGLFCDCIKIGAHYSIEVKNRILSEVLNHVQKYFKSKEDGK